MTTYIYESPDGGDTIYKRIAGTHARELHAVNENRQLKLKHQQRLALWENILSTAESDPALKTLLDNAEIYYSLKNSP